MIHDVRTIGGRIDIPSIPPTSGGTILETEEAAYETYEVRHAIEGHTGAGYVATDRNKGTTSITWNYHAPEAGRAILEFRYINSWNRQTPLSVTINGRYAGRVLLWDTGTSKTWAWDRLTVDVKEGDNQTRVQAKGRIMIDHVNVHYVGQ